MKKTGIMFIIAAIFAGCSPSNEKRAQKLVKEYMIVNLKDPKSYESISFSKLDSLFSPYISTQEGERLFTLSSYNGIYGNKKDEFEKRISTIVYIW